MKTLTPTSTEALAYNGGLKTISEPLNELFRWPIITDEDEQAALQVLRAGNMSGIDVTIQFEHEFAAWMGCRHALGFNNGTASLLAAMWAVGVQTGDEIICPATTYWASALPAFGLGATVRFADIEADTLCIDPAEIDRLVTPRTKAVVVVHYLGHPADMDPIMEAARRHGLAVIEDVSHAHGGHYKGRKLGSIGDIGCFSLMAGKPLAVGEGGMLVTSVRDYYERAVAFGHYERFNAQIESADLRPFAGLPFGGVKHRMHQLSAAVGRVQLEHYDQRSAEIRKAMNYFWDLLDGVPGLRPHRVDECLGSDMGGWYCAHGFYLKEEMGGLSLSRFCEAVRAEGMSINECMAGCNRPLHLHPLLNDADIYGAGVPTRIAHTAQDLRQPAGSLPVAEAAPSLTLFVPWFKHFRPKEIQKYADAFRKVVEHADELLQEDPGEPEAAGGWNLFRAKGGAS